MIVCIALSLVVFTHYNSALAIRITFHIDGIIILGANPVECVPCLSLGTRIHASSIMPPNCQVCQITQDTYSRYISKASFSKWKVSVWYGHFKYNRLV